MPVTTPLDVGRPRLSRLPRPLKGPRLVDVVINLIDAHNMTPKDVQKRYNVSESWLREMKANPDRSPQADTIQFMYEDLTGRPLLTGLPT
jgi:hypothetical protein